MNEILFQALIDVIGSGDDDLQTRASELVMNGVTHVIHGLPYSINHRDFYLEHQDAIESYLRILLLGGEDSECQYNMIELIYRLRDKCSSKDMSPKQIADHKNKIGEFLYNPTISLLTGDYDMIITDINDHLITEVAYAIAN